MKVCSVNGCNGKHCGLGFCKKHYNQYKRHGHILERTVFDTNNIIEYEDYAEVIMYNKAGEEVGRAIIDLDDVELVSKYKWYMDKDGYAQNHIVGKLHRFIIDCPSDMVVDHINHNTLDNRKINLRICTQAENSKNRGKRKNCSSQYKGVSLNKKANKWTALIYINDKRKYLGLFDNEYDASVAYDKSAIMYYREYAYLNHSIENYIDYILELGLDIDNFIR